MIIEIMLLLISSAFLKIQSFFITYLLELLIS